MQARGREGIHLSKGMEVGDPFSDRQKQFLSQSKNYIITVNGRTSRNNLHTRMGWRHTTAFVILSANLHT